MELTELIHHPERLDRNTLYELRSLLALYPYFQTARMLMLQNLYLLHDPSFDEELRRAAIYVTDRRVLFNLVEAPHYRLPSRESKSSGLSGDTAQAGNAGQTAPSADPPSRTLSLIDTFLGSLPPETPQPSKRKPTPADAAVDYVAYLLETQSEDQPEVPQMRGQNLIDSFINSDKPKFHLSEQPAEPLLVPSYEENVQEDGGEEYFTETLARIYIKQGRYSKALEIIQRLSLQVPKKNAYFADQIRFLEKLIINSKQK